LLARVENVQHLYRLGGHTVDQKIVRIDNGLARSWNTPRAVHVRELRQTLGTELDPFEQTASRSLIAFTDVGGEVIEFFQCILAPK
jgi:hypothetical protein